MKKKNITVIIILIVISIALIPTKLQYKDGGTVEYRAILYKVTKYHQINLDYDSGYKEGTEVKILGITVYQSNSLTEPVEHIVRVMIEDEKFKAYTGSFCYPKQCIDKLAFNEVSYEKIGYTSPGTEIYLENLNSKINSVTLYDYTTKEEIDIEVDFVSDSITTPNIEGQYIIKIDATYKSKPIEYSFAVDILNKTAETHSFYGKIIEITSKEIIIEPNNEAVEKSTSDKFVIEKPEGSTYKVGDEIKITYTGELNETYPVRLENVDIENAPKLTMNAIKQITKSKKENLTWSDFAEFQSYETGSGLYIKVYKIDDNYSLMIGGSKDSILYMRLESSDGSKSIDIRNENIDKFLKDIKG